MKIYMQFLPPSNFIINNSHEDVIILSKNYIQCASPSFKLRSLNYIFNTHADIGLLWQRWELSYYLRFLSWL